MLRLVLIGTAVSLHILGTTAVGLSVLLAKGYQRMQKLDPREDGTR